MAVKGKVTWRETADALETTGQEESAGGQTRKIPLHYFAPQVIVCRDR
jgi:hypothetical protein